MRTTALLLTLLLAVAMPASAQITEFRAFDGSADCNGWSVEATVHYWEGAMMVRLEYAVVLSDADGTEVERSEYAEWISFAAGQTVEMPLSGSWTAEPGADWQVRGDFILIDIVPDLENRDEVFFEATLDCGTGPGDGVDPEAPRCSYPPGWYRNHPEEWPVYELELAGELCDENTIMQLLKRRNRGLIPVILARQVIAAKFNLMNNPRDDVAAAVEAADAWLKEHSPFQRFSRKYLRSRAIRRDRRVVGSLIGPIVMYNHSGCVDAPAHPAAMADALADVDKLFADDPVAEEDVSFGAVKAMYR